MDENKNKTTGFLVTIGFHALIIFLLFVLPGFRLDNPGVTEPIEVELGGGGESGSDGGNNDNEISPPASQTTTEESSTTSDISTDENGEVTVPKEEKAKKSPVQTPKKVEPKTEKARVPEKGSTYKGKGKDPNKKPGEGDDDKGKGKTKGDNPDPGYSNTPGKNGGELKGRPQRAFPDFGKDFAEEGKLVFRIVVDRQGNVKKIKYVPPSFITNIDQINKAKQLILTYAKFNANPDADEEQIGYYSITYKKY